LPDALPISSLHHQRLTGVMGEHKDRRVKRRVVAPPALPLPVTPRPETAAEHIAAHDRRAQVFEIFPEHVIIRAGLAATPVAVHLAKELELDDPVMQIFATFADRVL